MPRIERFSATAPVPVKREQLIDPGAFRFSTAAAEGFKEIGSVLSELGERKRAADDSLAVNAAGESRDFAKKKIRQAMLDNPDPAAWAELREKIIAEQRNIFTKQKFSSRVGNNEKIEQTAFENGLRADVEIAITTQTIENDIAVTGKNLIDKIAHDDGSTEAAADIAKQLGMAQSALERKHAKDVAKIHLEETILSAQKEQKRVASDNLREASVVTPEGSIQAIDDEIAFRKKTGNPSDMFMHVSSQDLNSAKQLAQSTIVSNKNELQKQYDIEIGNFTSSVTKGIREGTITEADVWQMPIPVAIEKQADADAVRKMWAGTVDGLVSRQAAMQVASKKKDREDAYNPSLVSMLKTEARQADSSFVRLDVKRRAAAALAADEINDADYEYIATGADASFKTVVDKTIDDSEVQLKSILLRGTSSESLVPWMQAQAIGMRAADKDMTLEISAKLMADFAEVGRAKEWAVDQVRRDVEFSIGSLKPEGEVVGPPKEIRVDDVRLQFLRSQKIWLRKTDSQIVEEYRAWLQRNP